MFDKYWKNASKHMAEWTGYMDIVEIYAKEAFKAGEDSREKEIAEDKEWLLELLEAHNE